MKIVTEEYKEKIKMFGKQLIAKLFVYTDMTNDEIVTELSEYIVTEAGINLLATEKGWLEIDSEVINSVESFFDGGIMKSVMKGLNIDSNIGMPVGTVLNYKFGVLVEDGYEYIDYYNYVVHSSDYQADTNSYKIIAYDKMLYTMVEVDDEFIKELPYPLTLKDYLSEVCEKCNLQLEETIFVNSSKLVHRDYHSGINYTYRDIIEEISQLTGSIICINPDDKLQVLYPSETGEVIDEEWMKDTNVEIGENYGPVNSLVFSRASDSDTINRKDDESIEENGLKELKIKDNQMLSDDNRSEFIDDLFDHLNGLRYYAFDISSTGITYLELGDRFKLSIEGVEYPVILLNNTTTYDDGLAENLFAEIPEETKTDYSTSSLNDKDIKMASITVDKQNATVVLKATDDGSLVQVELGANASLGSSFKVKADNISLNGYISNEEENFAITPEGMAKFKNVEINGGNIELLDDGTDSESSLYIYSGEREQHTIKVGDIVGNRENLHFEFPNKITPNQSSSSIPKYTLVNFEHGRLVYNSGYMLSSYTNIWLEYDTNYDYQELYVYDNETEQVVTNKSVITTLHNLGTVLSVDAAYLDSNNSNQPILNYVKAEGDYSNITRFFSNGTSIKKNNISSFYGGNGITINDEYGSKIFNEEGLSWQTNTGINYADFIANKDYLIKSKGSSMLSLDFSTSDRNNDTMNLEINGTEQLKVSSSGVTCISLTQTSLEEMKKNIVKFESGLDLVKNSDVYTYNFNHEEDEVKRKIGFVIGENYRTPEEIISKDNNGIDTYSALSVLWRAVQEQQKMIEELMKERDTDG